MASNASPWPPAAACCGSQTWDPWCCGSQTCVCVPSQMHALAYAPHAFARSLWGADLGRRHGLLAAQAGLRAYHIITSDKYLGWIQVLECAASPYVCRTWGCASGFRRGACCPVSSMGGVWVPCVPCRRMCAEPAQAAAIPCCVTVLRWRIAVVDCGSSGTHSPRPGGGAAGRLQGSS